MARWRVLDQLLGQRYPALVDVMKAEEEKHTSLFLLASQALILIGNLAIPEVVNVLGDEKQNYYVRFQALMVLNSLCKPGLGDVEVHLVLPALFRLLQSSDSHLRYYAVRSLGQLESSATEAVPSLRKYMEGTRDVSERADAATAIYRIDPSNQWCIAVILEALKSGDSDHREGAVFNLGEIRTKDERILNALIKALKDENADVRLQAANVLSDLGSFARPAIPFLREALHDENEGVRKNAERCILWIEHSVERQE